MIERHPITDRESWLAWRRQDVTASAVPALLGIHPYVTPYGLWLLKTGKAEDVETSPAMRRGIILEEPVLSMLRDERPEWSIEKAAEYYRDPSIRLGATPDAYVLDAVRGPGLVQVKTAESSVFRKQWIDPETREVTPPLWIAVQATVEAHLTGRSWAVVAVLAVGFGVELHVVEIPLNLALVDRIRSEVAAFWRAVEEGKAPDPDYARDGKLIEMAYEPTGEVLNLSGDNALPALVDERARLSAEKSAAEERLREIKSTLLGKLAGASEGRIADGRLITAKRIDRAGYEVAPSSYIDLRVKNPRRNAA